MKRNKTLLLSLATLLIFSCSEKGGGFEGIAYEAIAEEEAAAPEAASRTDIPINGEDASLPTADKKVIKDGRIGIRVGDIAKAKEVVTALVTKYDGYFSRDTYDDSRSRLSYDLVIRIPSSNYDAFVAELDGVEKGKFLYKEINARDVTEEWVDIETRLTNKRAYLARYRDMVKRATTIEEVLEVEERIRVLEEEIESAEGRLRYMRDQVAYSTMNLNLVEDVEYAPADKESAWSRFKHSTAMGWEIVVELFYLLVKIWPLVVIGAGLLVFFRIKKLGRSDKL